MGRVERPPQSIIGLVSTAAFGTPIQEREALTSLKIIYTDILLRRSDDFFQNTDINTKNCLFFHDASKILLFHEVQVYLAFVSDMGRDLHLGRLSVLQCLWEGNDLHTKGAYNIFSFLCNPHLGLIPQLRVVRPCTDHQ